MKLRSTFLRSKVAQRIVLLFICCALLPVTILAVVSFFEVSSQLRQQSEKQLRYASKSQAMAIYERLQMLDSELQVISQQGDAKEGLQPRKILEGHFEGVGLITVDGRERSHWGAVLKLPPLTNDERNHLLGGNPLVRLGTCGDGNGTCVFLLRAVKAGGQGSSIVLGQLSPNYLWTPKSLSPDFQFCVLSAVRAVLFCSDEALYSGAAQFPNFDHAAGAYQWQSEGGIHDAAYWKLLIRPVFLQAPLTVVVTQKNAEVLAPMRNFRKSFLLIVLLSFWVVTLLSLVQVRRTLVPLERLHEATQKISAGQFDSRVEVHSRDEFESLAGSFNAMAAQLGRQLHTLKAINEIDQAIFKSLDQETIVDGVLAHVPKLFRCDFVGVCIFGESRHTGWARFRDVRTGKVHSEATSIVATDWLQLQSNTGGFGVHGEQRIPDYLGSLSRDGMKSFAVWPIRVDNSIQAILVCGQRDTSRIAIDDMPEARQVADQLSVAFSHVRLIQALEELHWGTLQALARAIDAKSEWTAGHSERVTDLAIQIGRRMGLSSRDLQIMHMGGLLHDIGKIGTPPTILDKPGKLTDQEMVIMQDHVRIGERILQPVKAFREALPIVAEHHEWFNGKGYPAGLAGTDISIYARILTVADCYDALTSDRPYRKGLSKEKTVEIIRDKSGVQFDPAVIDAFLQMMSETGSTGRTAMAASTAQV